MSVSKMDFPIYLFKEGTNSELYKLLGPSYVLYRGKMMWRFRVYAPAAKSISIVGDFNNWRREENPMKKLGKGIWECYISGLKQYDVYKLSIEGADGRIVNKADPFATHTETPPANASKLFDISGFNWTDEDFLKKRAMHNPYESPMNIYEVHAGSWRRHADGNYYSYRNLADELVPYLVEMGYTHVELLPITEHPLEMSWGYQVTGFFAPTSRFGTPHDFMYFVNKCHEAGIYVILDLVLSHFPKDEFGLFRFDGTPLFEYADEFKSEHKTWGTMVFDYGKGTVRSFLTSCAAFWLECYHIDGLRLDAVASMLYLDYDRKEGEWRPNREGGRYNLEAVDFVRKFNELILTRFPGVVTMAEESTAFPMVTMPPAIGGLGFNFKWNMGWMNDFLEYLNIDPFFRKGSHNKLTFGITYAFSENYVLPFSHDEVVHGKCSLISKTRGTYYDKFDAVKAALTYQMTHPGKKLNFMGNEIGQFIEWDFKRPLDWFLLEYETHRGVQKFVKALNKIYLTTPALYELDNSYQGFKWLVVDDNIQNVIAYYREDKKGDKVIVVINFSDVFRKKYRFGVPELGTYEIVLNSKNEESYDLKGERQNIKAEKIVSHGHSQSISIDLEGNSALLLKIKKKPLKKDKVASKTRK
jgi:1,4-alpha-glucan branching enzyme